MAHLSGKQLTIALLSLVCFLVVFVQISAIPSGVVSKFTQQAKIQLPLTTSTVEPVGEPLRIVISEDAAAHDEVVAALLQAWGEYPNAEITIFQLHPNRFGSKSVYDGLGVPNKFEVKHRDTLPTWLENNPAPDILIATTCEVFPFHIVQYLLDDHDTHLFCVAHHADRWDPIWTFLSLERKLTSWIRQDRVDFIALSHHTAQTLQEKSMALWDVIAKDKTAPRVHVLPPVFHIPDPEPMDPSKDIISYALQGNYEPSRRDYTKVFEELARAKAILVGQNGENTQKESGTNTGTSSVSFDLSLVTLTSVSSLLSSTPFPSSLNGTTSLPTAPSPTDILATNTSISSSASGLSSKSPSASVTIPKDSQPSEDSTTDELLFDGPPIAARNLPTPELNLRLVGSGPYRPVVPAELKSSVYFDANLNYTEFYKVLSHTTALIPGFADQDYFTTKASSSVPASLIAGSPLIATRKLLDAYTYLEERCVWLQGGGESEFDVLSRIIRLSFEERLRKVEAVRMCNVELVEENKALVMAWTDSALQRKAERVDLGLAAAMMEDGSGREDKVQ